MAKKRSPSGSRFLRMFGPLVRALHAHGGSARPREVYEWISEDLRLSAKEREARTPKGAVRYEVDIAFARFYLVRDGLIEASERGVWALTPKGARVKDISLAEAKQIEERVQQSRATTPSSNPRRARSQPTEAEGDRAEQILEIESHTGEILRILLAMHPSGFENFCQRLLREAGFENVEVTGRPGDGGIDGEGLLRVNALVSFKVLFQCKRLATAVGSKDVRNFRGAIQGKADKGIILTTSHFTRDAQNEAVRDGVPPLELVDGARIVEMMEQFGMGLVPRRAFEVDRRFFESFERGPGPRDRGNPGQVSARP